MAEMTQDSVVDELDLSIVDCLQIHPRASWTLIGEALGVDPVTVTRRWQRLSGDGTAWVTARAAGSGAPDSCLAVIELTCRAKRIEAIAQQVSALPYVLSLEHVSGPRALTLLVEVRNLAFLSGFLLGALGAIPGVVATQSHTITRVHMTGDIWPHRVLDARQRAVMLRVHQARSLQARTDSPGATRPYDATDRGIILALGEDGRMPVATLASRLAASESLVRRRLNDLVRHGRVVLRCDMSLPASGWPVIMWIWVHLPADPAAVGTVLHEVKELRVCFQITGSSATHLLALAAHSLVELTALESRLAAAAPGMTVIDRSIVLRSIKRMGRVLDESGRSIVVVPMDIWAPAAPSL